MSQMLKRRLAVMKFDQTNTPYKLASDLAEIIKTLRITPHSVTKFSPFEAHMGRKTNRPTSNIAISHSPNNLNRESARRCSEDEVCIKKKT